jgi:hypothetical protein
VPALKTQRKLRNTLVGGAIAAAAVVNFGQNNLSGFRTTTGTFFMDVAAASVVLEFRQSPIGPVLFTHPVALDGGQPANTYPWVDVPLRAPYVNLLVTNGAVPATVHRVFQQANP